MMFGLNTGDDSTSRYFSSFNRNRSIIRPGLFSFQVSLTKFAENAKICTGTTLTNCRDWFSSRFPVILQLVLFLFWYSHYASPQIHILDLLIFQRDLQSDFFPSHPLFSSLHMKQKEQQVPPVWGTQDVIEEPCRGSKWWSKSLLPQLKHSTMVCKHEHPIIHEQNGPYFGCVLKIHWQHGELLWLQSHFATAMAGFKSGGKNHLQNPLNHHESTMKSWKTTNERWQSADLPGMLL